MSGVFSLIAVVLSFGITALLGKRFIPFLKRVNFGQTIREEGPKWHIKKDGTPTMGGIMFIIGIVAATIIAIPVYYAVTGRDTFAVFGETTLMQVKVFGGLFMAIGFGAIGFFDDYIKVVKKRNLGLTAWQKLILQFLVAGAYLVTLYLAGEDTKTFIPALGYVDLSFGYWILSALLIVGMVNAVNFTDGIDGLNSSVTFFAALFFMLIGTVVDAVGISLLAVCIAGGCMGFLIWNFNPAKVFMGDTGSLFLGGAVCALGFGMDMPILLFPIGVVYITEILSVVIQVVYFKATGGKRLFKMSPIHHHFEMCGWSEIKICGVFSVVTVLFGILALIWVMFGI